MLHHKKLLAFLGTNDNIKGIELVVMEDRKFYQRKDGKKVEIYNKYWQKYGYPNNYLFDDIQNDKKIKGPTFDSLPVLPNATFPRMKMNDEGKPMISSAVFIQPSGRGIRHREMEYYCIKHYSRGMELASERGVEMDYTYTDIAQRTMVKELNIHPNILKELEIVGVVVGDGTSGIFMFTILNWKSMVKHVPDKILDKNIVSAGYCHYNELKPWSKWHIDIYNNVSANMFSIRMEM